MDNPTPQQTMSCAPYRQRRLSLIQRMQAAGGGIAVIPTAAERPRNRDTLFPFRADSYFQYLTGFNEPEAVLLIIAPPPNSATQAAQSILFCREKHPEREIWDGFRHGPELAKENFAFDAAYPITAFDQQFAEQLADQPALWYSLGHDAAWDARITAALNTVRSQGRSGKRAPAEIRDVHVTLDAMRLIKDEHELATMRRAGEIAAQAHCRAMRFTQPGQHEFEVEAELLHTFRRHGCEAPAYPSIVAGGANATVLHYVGNDQRLNDGDLLLIDAAGELDGYAADITRTFPVNGRFSPAQAAIYQLVLDAQLAAIAAVKPGASFLAPHEAALRVLAQGLIGLNLLSGTVAEALANESYKKFFMHRTSHWLGKDVHDAGEYRQGEQWATLQPGMVLTIEPGCYIRPDKDVPEAFWNIGVRIEDDAVVTTTGCEIITAGVPKTIADIEALMCKN
ncbi:MAG: Xaa-Pro aminopeptidase [Rugosibacter sp.]|nr:Xaa-Pro aminopeptidase [Rugosibacter sp.]